MIGEGKFGVIGGGALLIFSSSIIFLVPGTLPFTGSEEFYDELVPRSLGSGHPIQSADAEGAPTDDRSTTLKRVLTTI